MSDQYESTKIFPFLYLLTVGKYFGFFRGMNMAFSSNWEIIFWHLVLNCLLYNHILIKVKFFFFSFSSDLKEIYSPIVITIV